MGVDVTTAAGGVGLTLTTGGALCGALAGRGTTAWRTLGPVPPAVPEGVDVPPRTLPPDGRGGLVWALLALVVGVVRTAVPSGGVPAAGVVGRDVLDGAGLASWALLGEA